MIIFKKAETATEYRELYALRYKVYCLEKKWLNLKDYPDGEEKDEYDKRSIHFVALNPNGDVVGTLRLILNSNPNSLPIENHPSINGQLATKNGTEISRLAVDEHFRNGDVTLGLYRLIYHYSKGEHLDTFFIVVDPSFLKLLHLLDFNFMPIGKPAFYFGDLTVPAMWNLKDAEIYIKINNSRLYNWLQQDPTVITEERILSKLLRRR